MGTYRIASNCRPLIHAWWCSNIYYRRARICLHFECWGSEHWSRRWKQPSPLSNWAVHFLPALRYSPRTRSLPRESPQAQNPASLEIRKKTELTCLRSDKQQEQLRSTSIPFHSVIQMLKTSCFMSEIKRFRWLLWLGGRALVGSSRQVSWVR